MGNNARSDSNYSSVDITGDFYTTVDGFGYDDYANTILGMITDARFPSPFTFGIFGEWRRKWRRKGHILNNKY